MGQHNSQKLYGNYLGICVANNDPLKKGRVKVFIPHLSPNVYSNWTESSKDKKFKFLGKNVDSPLDDVIEEVKDILPWADCASPIAGEVSSGRYNAYNQSATISDSNDFKSSTPVKNFTPTKYSQNVDGTGEKPASILEKSDFALSDAFVSPGASGTNKANLYGQSYKPASYSNKAKGSFSVPPVGSHLWVFFIDGNPMYPVYFAASHGAEEWQGVYEFTDYPDSYENKSQAQGGSDHNVETYRNKYLINQKGGTLEFVNTDNKESLKLTHYSGSSIQFTNPATIYLATANEQHLILGDKFETVRGADNFYVDGDKDTIIRGDVYRKIGSLDSSAIQEWKDSMQSIADAKQRFEIQRTGSNNLFNSLQQNKSGSHGKCPVCQGGKVIPTLKNTPFKKVEISNVYVGSYPGGGSSPNKGYFETVDIDFPLRQRPPRRRPRDYLSRKGYSLNSEVSKYTYVDPRGIFQPGTPQNIALPATKRCPACNGTGLSPSSMGGNWGPDPIKEQLASLIANKATDLAKSEASLGLGGHEIVDITKHKIETIGLIMNDFGSVRIDDKGKMYSAQVLVDEEGVYENQKASPLIEYVHVDDLPGGNYTLTACNRYTLQVGAGGLSLKTFGPIQIGGSVVNIAGEQLNIGSTNEVNLDGGKRFTLVADIVYIKQRQMAQVMIDSSLGISRNLIVGGGAHIEGELSVNHITAPVEIQETELTKVYGITNDETIKVIGFRGTGEPIFSCLPDKDCYPDDNSILVYPHSHHFRNLPLTLVADNKGVRQAGTKNNNTDRNFASPQNDCKKGP